MALIQTPITRLLGIKHPILLAGMNQAAGPSLAAAVTNAGGLGSIGGVGYTPEMLRKQLEELKSELVDKNAPFGVDLLLPKVGEGARKTNYDYTEGKLEELIDIIIEAKARLFISAVGVPPKHVVDKLHSAGILCMNMIGSPKHVKKALAVGIDLICPQGGEGGGHTGDVAFSVLIPAVVDLCKGHKSPLTGEPVYVVAAGGIYDGRGLAAALSYGAQAVWVGTRFICATEAGATSRHQQAVIEAGYHDTIRTIIYTGRPMRVLKNERSMTNEIQKYILDWEENRQGELKELTSKGVIPAIKDFEESDNAENFIKYSPLLMGQIAGSIHEIKPAKEIVEEMVRDAISTIRSNHEKIVSKL